MFCGRKDMFSFTPYEWHFSIKIEDQNEDKSEHEKNLNNK